MAQLKPFDIKNHEPGTSSRMYPEWCGYGFHCHNAPKYSVYSEKGWIDVSCCDDEKHVDEASRWADAMEVSLAKRYPKYAAQRDVTSHAGIKWKPGEKR